MKALLCKEFGPPETLSYEEIEDPVLKEGHIIVDIHSASVNFPDVLMIEDKYQFKPPLPFAPGGEASGVISEIGDGVEVSMLVIELSHHLVGEALLKRY